MNQDIENKKELISFVNEKKVELEQMKHKMFFEKQNTMRANTQFLWDLKNEFLEKQHSQQLERMQKAREFQFKSK